MERLQIERAQLERRLAKAIGATVKTRRSGVPGMRWQDYACGLSARNRKLREWLRSKCAEEDARKVE